MSFEGLKIETFGYKIDIIKRIEHIHKLFLITIKDTEDIKVFKKICEICDFEEVVQYTKLTKAEGFNVF